MIYEFYQFIPFLSQIKNKAGFFLSFLFTKTCKIKLASGSEFRINKSDYLSIVNLLGISQMSFAVQDHPDHIKITFDGKNHFKISKALKKQDLALLDLLYHGLKAGAIFVDKNHDQPEHKKSIKIYQDKTYIIKTWEGVLFDLQNGAGAIVECFVSRIHDHYKFNGKVIDIGASIGDTPLYFASKGAKVFAVEISESNYTAMKNNLDLNPNLASRITIHNKAFGIQGTTQYWTDSLNRVSSLGGSSMFANKYGIHGTKKTVQGITIDQILDQFPSPDLLKLDCKGCEFLLDVEKISNIPTIKIEYYCLASHQKISDLAKNLEQHGYQTVFYKHTQSDNSSMTKHGNLLAVKIQN